MQQWILSFPGALRLPGKLSLSSLSRGLTREKGEGSVLASEPVFVERRATQRRAARTCLNRGEGRVVQREGEVLTGLQYTLFSGGVWTLRARQTLGRTGGSME